MATWPSVWECHLAPFCVNVTCGVSCLDQGVVKWEYCPETSKLFSKWQLLLSPFGKSSNCKTVLDRLPRTERNMGSRSLSPLHPWPLRRPKPLTCICLEYFEHRHLPPFILLWLDLGFWDGVSLGTQSGLELVRLMLLSPVCREGWQACTVLLGLALLCLPIQRQEYETPPHARREASTKITLKNNPPDSFNPRRRAQSVTT